MHVSLARIAANRKNALKSKGPTTAEGKSRSRANSLKHGLCAVVVVAEDLALVQERSLYWFNAIKPQNEAQAWLVNRVAILSIRIDRGERMERRARDKKALRAELCWEDDRALEAKRLGAILATRPEEVVEELRRTPQGCEWLISRWSMLARAADLKKSWTPEQIRLAFDLLGTPTEFREGNKPGDLLDLDGRVIQPGDDPAAVARREIAELMERAEAASDLDEVNQALAISDLDDEHDPELKRIRRYETANYRRLRWCLDQVHFKSPDHRQPLQHLLRGWSLTPAPLAEAPPHPLPEPEPVPEPEPYDFEANHFHPPFDLEPHEFPEPGKNADIPAIVAAREAKKLQKAANRREARRRRLKNLRA